MTAVEKTIAADARLVERRQDAARRRLICAGDLVALAMIVVCTPIAVLLPQRALFGLCRLAARLLPRRFSSLGTVRQIATTLEVSDAAAGDVMRRMLAARLISIFSFLRARLRGPSCTINLVGQQHLDAALAQGGGVVLWIADQVHGADVSKVALFEQGYRVSHLSRPEHGFSDTRFGLAVLNPIRQKFELRFLRERIVFDRKHRCEAAALMRARLAENGIVSVFASAYEGRMLTEAPFLNGRLRMAGGAPRLAFKARCPILPLFVCPSPVEPAFDVIIGAPLAMTSLDKEAAVLEATADYLNRFAPVVRRRPDLWRAWQQLTTHREASAEAVAPPIAKPSCSQPSLV